MAPRTGLTAHERALQSRLRQLRNEPGLLRGNLVEMRRQCGKATCGCQEEPVRRHRALYLGLSLQGRRRMIDIPRAWEARVRQWTGRHAEVRKVVEQISRAHLPRVERRVEQALLRRFAGYLERQFGFRQLVAGLQDRRCCPQVATAMVWLAVFLMFALRQRRFHAVEQELRRPRRGESWLGPGRKPSADTLGRVPGGGR